MSALALDQLWFNDVADPSDVRGFAYAGDSYKVTPTAGGGVEDGYASGRSRGYTTADDTVAVEVTLQYLDPDDVVWLEAHRGRPLWFRDPRGRKVAVSYYTSPFTTPTAPAAMAIGRETCDLSLASVTVSEAV